MCFSFLTRVWVQLCRKIASNINANQICKTSGSPFSKNWSMLTYVSFVQKLIYKATDIFFSGSWKWLTYSVLGDRTPCEGRFAEMSNGAGFGEVFRGEKRGRKLIIPKRVPKWTAFRVVWYRFWTQSRKRSRTQKAERRRFSLFLL